MQPFHELRHVTDGQGCDRSCWVRYSIRRYNNRNKSNQSSKEWYRNLGAGDCCRKLWQLGIRSAGTHRKNVHQPLPPSTCHAPASPCLVQHGRKTALRRPHPPSSQPSRGTHCSAAASNTKSYTSAPLSEGIIGELRVTWPSGTSSGRVYLSGDGLRK